MYFNEGDLRLTVGKISIKNGTYQNLTRTERAPYPYFDALNLLFDKINGSVSDLSFIKDTIKADINLAAKERSGLDIRKLKSNLRLTPQMMEFSKLELVTPRSRLQNYVALQYKDFNKDFSNFIEKVSMDIRLRNAEIDSYDLAYFAPAAKSWNKKISISGNAKGTVGNLSAKNLFVRAGNNTTISGDLSMIGLPAINKTIIDFQSGNLQTSYRDAVTFIPAIAKVKVPSLSSLGNIKFKGNFKGTTSKFATNGTFSTNLGGLVPTW